MPATNEIIKVLIVDDEKKACSNLRSILSEFVDVKINVAGIAHSGVEAGRLVSEMSPDAIFLDIEMPNENAFEFLARISPFNFEVIFVTAYDEYAVRAFRLNAIDYILKPISINELKNAVLKLREKLLYKKMAASGAIEYDVLAEQFFNKAKHNSITLKDINGIEVVPFKNIYYVEAQSSYSRVVFVKNAEVKEMTVTNPLSYYEDVLPTEVFFRIHRSYLINCTQLKKILNEEVIANDGFAIPVSRRRYNSLIDFLKTNGVQ